MTGNVSGNQKGPNAGGIAINSGINFQASVTAYACVRMLEGQALNWLKGICVDVPVAIQPESGGPGDDLRIEYRAGFTAEVQVKKGLKVDDRLWKTLDTLALALHEQRLAYAVLVVDPDSSRSIRRELAADIIKIGHGQPASGTLMARWMKRLAELGVCIEATCKRFRIHVVHGTLDAGSGIELAKTVLRQLLAKNESAEKAWAVLQEHVGSQMEARGRMTGESLVTMLANKGFAWRADGCPSATGIAFRRWVEAQHATFALAGVRKRLPLSSLLPMSVCRYTWPSTRKESLEAALKNYRAGAEAKRYGERFAMDWLARFKHRVVIVAGPGQGKSMALKVLAYRYSVDGYYVLHVQLKQLSRAISDGSTFRKALLDMALGSSPIREDAFLSTDPSRWVLLADGLDECGVAHDRMAREIRAFVQGNPGMRAVIATRPIGYETAELVDWAHYAIIPPAKDEGSANLSKLMAAAETDGRTTETYERIAELQLRRSPAAEAISTSPQLLAMAACLLLEDHELPQSRSELYVRFLRMYDKLPFEAEKPEKRIAETVLNVLGWHLRQSPAVARCGLAIECTVEIERLTGWSSYLAGTQVEEALLHWERVGLVEVLRHGGTELLTFTHLSFAEFLAARHLNEQHERLLAGVIHEPQWQEVIDHAIELGMARGLAEHFWTRHAQGDLEALHQALTWAAKSVTFTSAAGLDRLVTATTEALTHAVPLPDSHRFKLGHALCGIAVMASQHLEPWLRVQLDAADPALKLIAWGVAGQSGLSLLDTGKLQLAYTQLLKLHGKEADPRDFFLTRERFDELLLQHVALAALKSCSQDELRGFSQALLEEKRLRGSFEFRSKVHWVLYERGIRDEPKEMSIRDKLRHLGRPTPRPSPEMIERYRSLSRRVSQLLAKALGHKQSSSAAVARPLNAFPCFAALLSVCELDRFNLREEFEDHEPLDPGSLGSTLKDFSKLLGLDLAELAWEAMEVLRRLDTDPAFTLFDHLPQVDCEYDHEQEMPTCLVNVEHAKLNLLNGPSRFRVVAGLLLLRARPGEQELVELLHHASGPAVRCASLLLEAHYPERAIERLVDYLESASDDNVEGPLESLYRLQAQPRGGFEALVIKYLTADCLETAVYAMDIVERWVEQGVFSNTQPIVKAIAHWQGRPSVPDLGDRDLYSGLNQVLAVLTSSNS